MKNVAEELFEVYLAEKYPIKPDGEDLRRVRENFFHGLYCGQDMIMKAMKMPDQKMVTFIREFRNQIHEGLTKQNSIIIPPNITLN
jgi:hypothetical protein